MNTYGYIFMALVLAFIGIIAFSVKFGKLPEEMEAQQPNETE